MKVLIVDDEILVSEALADAVRAQGHEVIIANDAEEALALLSHLQPDAILLDVALKDLSGIDVLRRIRQTNPSLPVVLVTGNASRAQLEEAVRLNVTDILEKPFALTRLSEGLRILDNSGAS
jgi:two-component system OmpR family response regulator